MHFAEMLVILSLPDSEQTVPSVLRQPSSEFIKSSGSDLGHLKQNSGKPLLTDISMNSFSGDTSPLCCISYKYKQYIVKHNSINDFIKDYFLHCFVQRRVSALVMSRLQVDYFSFFFCGSAAQRGPWPPHS